MCYVHVGEMLTGVETELSCIKKPLVCLATLNFSSFPDLMKISGSYWILVITLLPPSEGCDRGHVHQRLSLNIT